MHQYHTILDKDQSTFHECKRVHSNILRLSCTLVCNLVEHRYKMANMNKRDFLRYFDIANMDHKEMEDKDLVAQVLKTLVVDLENLKIVR